MVIKVDRTVEGEDNHGSPGVVSDRMDYYDSHVVPRSVETKRMRGTKERNRMTGRIHIRVLSQHPLTNRETLTISQHPLKGRETKTITCLSLTMF